MPVRFTSPSLGGQRNSFIGAGEWQVGVAYRRLTADEWYVGTQVNEARAPFGQPLYLNINSLDFSVSYGLSDRLSLTLTLPFSYGTHSRFYADTARHKVSAHGLGDVNLVGNLWLLDPKVDVAGNVALGLGIKTPSGAYEFKDDFFLPNAPPVQRPVDQAIELGDGGWGIMVQAQAYKQVLTRTSAYFFGAYLISPREKYALVRVKTCTSAYFFGAYLISPRESTEVASPIPGTPVVHLAVPDVYLARAGMAYALAPARGISLSLGGRIDGIPQGDLIGGRDNSFRRPGYSLYLDPGIALRRGDEEFTLSLPVRVHQDFQRSSIDQQRSFTGGGDLAEYLIFLGYTHRF